MNQKDGDFFDLVYFYLNYQDVEINNYAPKNFSKAILEFIIKNGKKQEEKIKS